MKTLNKITPKEAREWHAIMVWDDVHKAVVEAARKRGMGVNELMRKLFDVK